MNMKLSKQNIRNIKPLPGLVIPKENLFTLPERVLQFGTGVLLRGLPDYYIDKANRQGIFNGRVVIVKSTHQGGTDSFAKQDGLYTQCIRGMENGKRIEENIINSSISRVLSAKDEWQKILDCALEPDMQVIISNTTEIGIVLENDDIFQSPPSSFPGKLLAFLLARYKKFKGEAGSGMVIIPTELIPDNATRLFSILKELGKMNGLDDPFLAWLEKGNHFCNSLVDRIVPGALPPAEKEKTFEYLGYEDELMIMTESFGLWAIESADPSTRDILSFASVDKGIVIAPSIEKFRELKLRLLNGTHTFSCGLGHLAGFATVKDAMENEVMADYIEKVCTEEIVTAITGDLIPMADAREFATQVLDRFRNPFLDHKWTSICVQYTSKMKMRNIPLIIKYLNKRGRVPEYMALGFAAYLLYMKGAASEDGKFSGSMNGNNYPIQDDHAGYLAESWNIGDPASVANEVLSNSELWGIDLTDTGRFSESVKNYLESLITNGVISTISSVQFDRTTV